MHSPARTAYLIRSENSAQRLFRAYLNILLDLGLASWRAGIPTAATKLRRPRLRIGTNIAYAQAELNVSLLYTPTHLFLSVCVRARAYYLCLSVQEYRSFNMPNKTRAGRLLCRAHAARNEYSLSVASIDAALEGSKAGELLFSESLTVREKVLVGRAAAAGGSGAYWAEQAGKERLSDEAMQRMAGDRREGCSNACCCMACDAHMRGAASLCHRRRRSRLFLMVLLR